MVTLILREKTKNYKKTLATIDHTVKITDELADILADLDEYYFITKDIKDKQKFIKALSCLTGLPNLPFFNIEELISKPHRIGFISSEYSGIGDFDDIDDWED